MSARPYIPTPEEIAEACERIQSRWDERTRLARYYAARSLLVSEVEPIAAPLVGVRDLFGGADGGE